MRSALVSLRGKKGIALALAGTEVRTTPVQRAARAISPTVTTERLRDSTLMAATRSTWWRQLKLWRAFQTGLTGLRRLHCCAPVSLHSTRCGTAAPVRAILWQFRELAGSGI